MLDAHLIETDSYDREAFARSSRSVDGLAELKARGERLVPHFDALLEDLFAVLFKLVIRPRPAEKIPGSALINRQILDSAVRAPGFLLLKEETALDAARAAHAACDLARRALTLLKTGEILLEEELLSAKELAREEEALERNQAAADELGDEAGKLKEKLAAAVQRGKTRTGALAENLKRAVSEMPPRFTSELAARTEKLSQDLPEGEESADSFARSVGGNGPRSAGERLKLAEKLAGNDKLKKLARLAGAFRADARAMRRKRRERSTSEVFRVGLGADLGRILPSELVMLGQPQRKKDFLRRFLEKRLVQYDLRGDDHQGRGPLVVCIDGSGSMSGPRELWAKAVTLALLDIARRQGRRAEAIVFSGAESPLSIFQLNRRGRMTRKTADLDEIVKLAECFPGGGTDFEKPLSAALESVKRTEMKGADIVFITDGEAQIQEKFAAEFALEKKKRDFSVYGVLVDDPSKNAVKGAGLDEKAARELGRVADWMTTVTQLTSGSIKELFRAI